MRLIKSISENWEDRWQQVAKNTLTVIVVLSAFAIALLALFGLFD